MTFTDRFLKVVQIVVGIGILWSAFIGLVVLVPTPFQTDVEAGEVWQQSQVEEACRQVVDLYWRIHQAEIDLENPAVPEWFKAKLRGDLPRWREVLAGWRRDYPQCDRYIPV